MEYLLGYIILFLILLIIIYIFTFKLKDKKDELGLNKAFNFITRKYNLNMDKKRTRILSKILVVINTFILSIPIYLIFIIDLNYIEVLLISLIIFIILIISLYNLIGVILKKKGW